MQAAMRRSCVSNFCLVDRDGFLGGDTFMCVGLFRQGIFPDAARSTPSRETLAAPALERAATLLRSVHARLTNGGNGEFFSHARG
jgi:hypothetical protein